MAHGGVVNRRAVATGPGASRGIPLADHELAEFCHWPAAPQPAQRSQLTARANWPQLAAGVSRALFGPFAWPAPLPPPLGQARQDTDDNPGIPSGFTYLLQLVGHDLVNTQTPLWAVEPGLGTSNLQANPLRLGVLYGGGPATCPMAYAPAGADGQDRVALRLGSFNPSLLPALTTNHFADMERVAVDNCVETLVADSRNTDNAVLSQLTVLFAQMHNSVAAAIDGNAGFGSAGPASMRPRAVFEQARRVVETIYRRIVFGELLDKILHPQVLDAYRSGQAPLRTQPGTPLELSHAVLRFGHAMVRDFYFLREDDAIFATLPQSLVFAGPAQIDPTHAGRVTIAPFWLMQWSRFFDLGIAGVSPNYSRRIGPGMSSSLFDPMLFPPIGEPVPLGLPYRDTKSALLAGLWSVDALIAEIQHSAPTLLPAGWARANVATWLTDQNTWRGLGLLPADIAAVAADPPLSIYMLLEAALDTGNAGRHLGVLGSIIFADVLFGLDAAQVVAPQQSALPQAEQTLVDAIATMADCVRYIATKVTVPAGGLPLF